MHSQRRIIFEIIVFVQVLGSLSSDVSSLSNEWDLTEQEVERFGLPSPARNPKLLQEFVQWAVAARVFLLRPRRPRPGVAQSLARRFCEQERAEGCTWREYQDIVSTIFKPHKSSFDHSHLEGVVSYEHWPKLMQCDESQGVPTPETFLQTVAASRPTIFRGAVNHWPAIHKWSTAYLKQQIPNATFSVATTPHNNFDCVEDVSLWQNNTDAFLHERESVLVRPAKINMSMDELLDGINAAAGPSIYADQVPLTLMAEALLASSRGLLLDDLGRVLDEAAARSISAPSSSYDMIK